MCTVSRTTTQHVRSVYPTVPHFLSHFLNLRHTQITALKRSLGQGNVFTPVCHSVHGGVGFPAYTGEGGLASQHALGRGVGFPACTEKGRGLASQHVLGRGVGFPACTGEGGWLPSMHWEGGLASQHALRRGGGWLPSMYWGGGLLPSMHQEKRAVCILLEYFLVIQHFQK